MNSFFGHGITAVLLAVIVSCAPVSEEVAARPTDLVSFAEQLEGALTANAWQTILAAADPALYRSSVVDAGTPEPRFVAELLGLHGSIQEGDELDWDDLERIESADLVPPEGTSGSPAITGSVILEDGAVLRVTAYTSRVQGRFVLTEGAP